VFKPLAVDAVQFNTKDVVRHFWMKVGKIMISDKKRHKSEIEANSKALFQTSRSAPDTLIIIQLICL